LTANLPKVVVVTLYRFVRLPDHRELRTRLADLCQQLDITGTLLLAPEGINGTLAGSRGAVDEFRSVLLDDPRFQQTEYKESFTADMPFYRMKVRIKKEIVTLGEPAADPIRRVGTYVAPEDWNTLISDPDILVIDTRNDYEVRMGTFQGAINPATGSFREFPAFLRQSLSPERHRKIAMFCTGGIRCEKASSLLLAEGFEEVYHLKGGILKYLEIVPEYKSLWNGECFVFDQRVSVTHGLRPGGYQLCYGCRHPLSPADISSPHYEAGVSCCHCHGALTTGKRAGARERHRQVTLARAKNLRHLGPQQ
jgi:UPF0176 protein